MTAPTSTGRPPSLIKRIGAVFDTSALPAGPAARGIDPVRLGAFLAMHVACLLVLVVGVSRIAILCALGLYTLRMFVITAFYHRYFSHRAFKTSRALQFAMAFLGCCAVQRGPLWWAAHHRHHHRNSDQPEDLHSPRQSGFLWSHCGWFLARENGPTRHALVRDLGRYPELRFLDRFDLLPPLVMGVLLWLLGNALAASHPEVSGWQLVVWGCFVSTVITYHATYTINSFAHRFGRRRYQTRDDSRNNVWLALLTLGEGWHNNHHHYAPSARQGFFWWEIDMSYYALKVLSWLRLVWDLRPVPAKVRAPEQRGGRR